jgi:hypothetical protein
MERTLGSQQLEVAENRTSEEPAWLKMSKSAKLLA